MDTALNVQNVRFGNSKLQKAMLQLQSDAENAEELEAMTNLVIHNYVKKHHKYSITRISNGNGKNVGRWRTYVIEGGKRKEIKKKTEEDLYKALYDFYHQGLTRPVTLRDVFEQLVEHKLTRLGRSKQTIYLDRRHFSDVSMKLQNTPIVTITEEDIQQWLMDDYLTKQPKEEALRKEFQLLAQIFDYGIRKRACLDNPMTYLSIQDYMQFCDRKKKKDEERAFSEAEINDIQNEVSKTLNNPRSLMVLVSIETGVRSGELAALHVSDVEEDYLHIHRQQRRISADGKNILEELPYTKDERMHPHDGRRVPMTEACRKAVNLALNLPGNSEYLFHDAAGKAISPDTYNYYLRRVCTRLGISTTNNHAFRLAFNTRMIDLGFSSAERALILGHKVQTNEIHYSVSDKRRLERLKTSIVNDHQER